MTNTSSKTVNDSLTGPIYYEIRVRGQLDPLWSDWFNDFVITSSCDESLLTGCITDQAALHGVLDRIRDMGLVLVSIQPAEKRNESHLSKPIGVQIITTQSPLPTTLNIRAVQRADLYGIVRLVYEICESEGDTSVATTPEELENEWEFEGFDPEHDAFVVQAQTGCLVGYGAVFDVDEHSEMSGDIYVHPQYKDQGVEAALLSALENRVHLQHIPLAAPEQRVFIRVALDNKDEAGKTNLVQKGYTPGRYHWRMGIELESAPPTPVLPDGLEFRPFIKEEHATAIWKARNEAFQGNWGSRQFSFEEFSYFTFENPEYDPSLWMVVWDGSEVAGFSINQYRNGIGWIHIIAVRPAWRSMKLGLALLYRSFNEFYQRGTKSIGLGVDAANVTGATKLYQKVGMTTISEFVTMEKELHPGKEA